MVSEIPTRNSTFGWPLTSFTWRQAEDILEISIILANGGELWGALTCFVWLTEVQGDWRIVSGKILYICAHKHRNLGQNDISLRNFRILLTHQLWDDTWVWKKCFPLLHVTRKELECFGNKSVFCGCTYSNRETGPRQMLLTGEKPDRSQE